jgi:hypothetical protein
VLKLRNSAKGQKWVRFPLPAIFILRNGCFSVKKGSGRTPGRQIPLMFTDNHSKTRLAVKDDTSAPPIFDASTIQTAATKAAMAEAKVAN